MTNRYLVVIHIGEDGIWSEVPDFPGCRTYASTINLVEEHTKYAIESRIKWMINKGLKIPECINENNIESGLNCIKSYVNINIK